MTGSMFFPDAEVTTLVEQINQIPRADNAVVLLFIGEHSTFSVPELLAALRAQQIPVAGGVFPGIIYGDQKYDSGVVADVVPQIQAPSLVTGLDNANFQVNDLPRPPKDHQYTALVLVDGLTKHVALFLDRLFRRLGNQVSYLGGGAGSLSFQQKPCVFDSQGIYQDAAVVLWLKTTTSLGVRHGWRHLQGPFVANMTEGPSVRQLSNRPALQTYSQIIKIETGKTLTRENFFDIAKGYPLGIYHPKMDHIVRDPITFTDDNALVCVGEVPPRSLIYVLKGSKQSLIDSAHVATNEATRNGGAGEHNLVIDCISRVLYLEEDFGKELAAVVEALPENAPTPYGVLSLGEIATYQTGRVEFFNKTFVVGSLQEIHG